VSNKDQKEYQAMLRAVEKKREKDTGIETTITTIIMRTTVVGGHRQANNG
jgi:hypothetical protein